MTDFEIYFASVGAVSFASALFVVRLVPRRPWLHSLMRPMLCCLAGAAEVFSLCALLLGLPTPAALWMAASATWLWAWTRTLPPRPPRRRTVLASAGAR